jgi:hypothetical protein
MAKMTIDAKKIVGKEVDPTTDGRSLAAYIVKNHVDLDGLTIDVRSLAPEDLVSSFVNALLHDLELARYQVRAATSITWKAKFPSEASRLSQLVSYYVADAS